MHLHLLLYSSTIKSHHFCLCFVSDRILSAKLANVDRLNSCAKSWDEGRKEQQVSV